MPPSEAYAPTTRQATADLVRDILPGAPPAPVGGRREESPDDVEVDPGPVVADLDAARLGLGRVTHTSSLPSTRLLSLRGESGHG